MSQSRSAPGQLWNLRRMEPTVGGEEGSRRFWWKAGEGKRGDSRRLDVIAGASAVSPRAAAGARPGFPDTSNSRISRVWTLKGFDLVYARFRLQASRLLCLSLLRRAALNRRFSRPRRPMTLLPSRPTDFRTPDIAIETAH